MPPDRNSAAAQMLLGWAKEDDSLTDEASTENEKILLAIDEDRLSNRMLFSHLFTDTES
jgi:hypothetical protein